MADTVSQSIFPTSAGRNTSVVSQAVGATTVSSDQTQLVEDFDAFLEILVAQIQNQDPTDPVDTQSFTDQLVQFSELEQQIQSNDSLESILTTIQSQNAASVVSYIGSTVTADGATTTLSGGQATYNLNVAETVPNANIQIRDQFGRVVFETQQALVAGDNEFVFQGQNADGFQLNDGDALTITATGESQEGNFVSVNTSISGVVDGVDFSSSVPSLRVGPATIPLSSVSSVNQTSS